MDKIDKSKYDEAAKEESLPVPSGPIKHDITDAEMKALMVELENPVNPQREIAAKIKAFLDARIAQEMEEQEYLSDYVRSWVKTYNDMLNDLQKNMHGDKSIHLHKHVVSHSTIAAKIRKHAPVVVEAEIVKETGDER